MLCLTAYYLVIVASDLPSRGDVETMTGALHAVVIFLRLFFFSSACVLPGTLSRNWVVGFLIAVAVSGCQLCVVFFALFALLEFTFEGKIWFDSD